MEIMIRDSRAVCTNCSGLLRVAVPFQIYVCHDCKKRYKAVKEGYTDSSVVVKEIGYTKRH